MSDQKCATCARCTPLELADGNVAGECSVIGAMVRPEETGQLCKIYRRAGVETVRVRIAVAVSDTYWKAFGRYGQDDETAMEEVEAYFNARTAVYWIEADIPVPVSETVEGVMS